MDFYDRIEQDEILLWQGNEFSLMNVFIAHFFSFRQLSTLNEFVNFIEFVPLKDMDLINRSSRLLIPTNQRLW